MMQVSDWPLLTLSAAHTPHIPSLHHHAQPTSSSRLFLSPGPTLAPVYEGLHGAPFVLVHILAARQRSLPFSLHLRSTHRLTSVPCHILSPGCSDFADRT